MVVKRCVSLSVREGPCIVQPLMRIAAERLDRITGLPVQDGSYLAELLHPGYLRPAEVDFLKGDASKAKVKLGREPKVRFHDLVRIMRNEDIRMLDEQPTRGDALSAQS